MFVGAFCFLYSDFPHTRGESIVFVGSLLLLFCLIFYVLKHLQCSPGTVSVISPDRCLQGMFWAKKKHVSSLCVSSIEIILSQLSKK